MTRFYRILIVLVLAETCLAGRPLFSQNYPSGDAQGGRGTGGGFPGGGFGGRGGGFGGGGFGGGGFGGGGFGRRGFGGGGFGGGGFGGQGADGLGNINAADLVRRLDTNHDGVIETSEMNDRIRPLLQRAGLKTDEPISNDQAIAAFEKLKNQSGPGGRFPGGGDDDFGYSAGATSSAQTGSSSSKKQDSAVPALVPAFGEPNDLTPVPGFGEGLTMATASFGGDAQSITASTPSSSGSTPSSGSSSAGSSAAGAEDPKIRSYAMSLMKRYDKNGDGVIDKSEWSQMSGDPEKYDRNHDGKITLDELIEGLKNWNRSSDDSSSASKPASSAAASTTTTGRPQSNTAAPTADSSSSGIQSGRGGVFATRRPDSGGGRNTSSASNGPHYRSPKDRLPDGLPDWFTSADADGDGQVSMHEFANPMTEEKIAEFNKYDLNGDGFITPDEVLKVSPPKK